jgi:hypothetical protein
MRFDNDEPQHLHVVWAWATGHLPYRDVFDNHAPLFQWLTSPFLRLLGERPNIVIPMRWVCIPFYFLSVYFVFRAGRAVLSAKAAFWAAVLGSLIPRGFLKSVEYRPDDLWTVVWFAYLAVLVTGNATRRRALVAGVIMGISFAVSMKSTLMVLASAASFLVLFFLRWLVGKERPPILKWFSMGLVALGGVVILPALVVAYFYFHGALLPSQSGVCSLWYNVIEHNIVPGLKRSTQPHYFDPWILGLLAALILGAIAIYRTEDSAPVRPRKVFLFLAPGFYLYFLYGFWPDITREDDPPFYPLVGLMLFILCTPWVGRRWVSLSSRARSLVPWLAGACLVAWLFVTDHPWEKKNRRQVSTMSVVLKLTTPQDYVMDAKSGFVFRQRPFYFITETITRARMRRNLIHDDIAKSLIETKTTVADFRGYAHELKGEAFIFANYLPLKENDSIGVVGKCLKWDPSTVGETIRFHLPIGARYAIVDQSGPVTGTLDGVPFDQPREVAVGDHTFVPAKADAKLLIVLAKALEVGYHPRAMETGEKKHKDKSVPKSAASIARPDFLDALQARN